MTTHPQWYHPQPPLDKTQYKSAQRRTHLMTNHTSEWDVVPRELNQSSMPHIAARCSCGGTQPVCQFQPWSLQALLRPEWGLASVLPDDQFQHAQPGGEEGEGVVVRSQWNSGAAMLNALLTVDLYMSQTTTPIWRLPETTFLCTGMYYCY